MSNELIQVVQLPVIEEQLRTLKDRWEQRAADAESMVCTEDTIQAVKSFHAEMRKEFEEVDALRKQIKEQLTAPAARLDDTFKRFVRDSYNAADAACKLKIATVESDIKERCEAELREYFSELCAVQHLDWLTYEQAGIKVDMASAKAKTPKKLREQLATFVTQVGDSVDCIANLDNADEIMVEFRRTLNSTDAIRTVFDRHQRIEAERASHEARKAEQERDAEMVRRVEALAPPVTVEAPEPVVKCTFTVRAIKQQLRKLREFLNMEGIQYE